MSGEGHVADATWDLPPGADPVATFASRAGSEGARVATIASADLATRLEALRVETGLPEVRAAPSVAERFPEIGRTFASAGARDPAGRYLGVAVARLAVAQTGSVLLAEPPSDAGPDLAEVCVCLVPSGTLVATLAEALASIESGFCKGRFPGDPVLVTGPSRTGDIEQIMTVGVHGPRVLHLWCLLEGPS